MGFFQKVRDVLGLNSPIEDSPIETLDKLIEAESTIIAAIDNAKQAYNEANASWDSAILAVEKGGDPVLQLNVIAYNKRKDRLTNEFRDQILILNRDLAKATEARVAHETAILTKCVETVAMLEEDERREVGVLMRVWEGTGEVAGEVYGSQLKAMEAAIVAATLPLEKSHDQISQIPELSESNTGQYAGHYANVIIRQDDKILFLKRAYDKVLAPGQYCVPGGHIDAGESITQAGLRELKEEAGLTANYAHILGKAKCENGKWAFYMAASPEDFDLKLLDSESIGAAWMTRDEWSKADLFFDLKQHLLALCDDHCEVDIDTVPTLTKGIDGTITLEKASFVSKPGSRGGKIIGHTRSGKPIYETAKHHKHADFTHEDHADAAKAQRNRKTASHTNRYMFDSHAKHHEEKAGIRKAEDDYYDLLHMAIQITQEAELVKGGKVGAIGEKRVWGGVEYVKTGHGWIKTKHSKETKELEDKKKGKRHATATITAHAENTSTDQLNKVASDEKKEHHVRDAAKREIERRNEPKETEKRQWEREDKVRAKDKKDAKAEEAKEKEKEVAKAKKEAIAKKKENKSDDGKIISNESLSYLTGAPGSVPAIGEETGKVKPEGISVLKSPFGSHRYVMSKNGKIVSAIQVMSANGTSGYVANVFTDKSERRKGNGKALIEKIK
jgi:8-oxo-dGTP diphosphatase